MRWRGWNASARSGGSGFAGSARGLGFGFELFISTRGKSVMGPDQVSSVLSKAGWWVAAAGKRGDGRTIKTICHSAAATRARRGIRRSTQHSLKKLPSRKFFGTRVQVRKAATLLPMPWWKDPQATSSLGPSPVSRWKGAAAGVVARPQRLDATLTWDQGMLGSIGPCDSSPAPFRQTGIEHSKIDETRPAGDYSAELFFIASFAAAAAVKTQG